MSVRRILRAFAVTTLVLSQAVFNPVSYACSHDGHQGFERPSCCCHSSSDAKPGCEGCCEIEAAKPQTAVPSASGEQVPLYASPAHAAFAVAEQVPPFVSPVSASTGPPHRYTRPIFLSHCSYRI
jgi:hypothetical protein